MPLESEKQLLVSGSSHDKFHALYDGSALEPALEFAAQHAPFLTQHFQPGTEFTVLPSMMLQPCDCEWA